MGKLRLSHSKRGKYRECPKRYDFHYNYKYRTKTLGSPLFFGVALDEAFNRLLLEKKKDLTESETKLMVNTPEEVFLKYLTNTRHNDQYVYIPTFEHCQYSKADFDISIFSEKDFEELNCDAEFAKAHMEWYYDEAKSKNPQIEKEDRDIYNLLNWTSLKNKGLMLIEAYRKEVMPQIHEVFAIQERVKLPNENGDYIEGIIDFVASFTDSPDTVYIVDNKTASKAYKRQELEESDQLHLYAYYKELNDIAYIVCEKNIRKREPKVRITILKGEVSSLFTDSLLDDYENTLYSIKEEKFNPDYKSGCAFFGRKCEYYDICHHEKFDDNKLVDMKRVKK